MLWPLQFRRFPANFRRKVLIFLEIQCYDRFVAQISSVLCQKCPTFRQFMWENISKIITLAPWKLQIHLTSYVAAPAAESFQIKIMAFVSNHIQASWKDKNSYKCTFVKKNNNVPIKELQLFSFFLKKYFGLMHFVLDNKVNFSQQHCKVIPNTLLPGRIRNGDFPNITS
jgi:hypothetical protein